MANKKIFVGNLAWKATEDELKSLFEEVGPVASVKIVSDQYTGRSKGFAFVEMENADDVDKVVDELNDKPLHDRNLRVSQARERENRSSGPRERSNY